MSDKKIIDIRDLEKSDILCIMKTQAGRNVVRRILQLSGSEIDTFDVDPILHARKAGRRSVGLWLINEIKEAAPDYYITLMREILEDG